MDPPSFLTSSTLVALGGGFGAWLRLLASRVMPAAPGGFPWATLTVNVLGSLAIGLLVGWLARQGEQGEGWRLLLGVGVLGGFTTFSAFSFELAGFIEKGATGMAAAYAALSLAGGIAGFFLGLVVMRVPT